LAKSPQPPVPVIDDPITIFSSLKRTKEFETLWPAEEEILAKYYKELSQNARLAIQLPTGSGKSLIGILIAEAWRRKGKHVGILTSTRALTEDMKNKCEALGVDSVIIGGKSQSEQENRQRLRNVKSYKRNQAIGIFNYWSYMMAKDIEEADVLIIDDADNFEGYLSDHYSVRIPRSSDIWYQIVRRLKEYKIYQKLDSFLVGRMADDYQVVYFLHSIEMAEEAKRAILRADPNTLPDGLLADFEDNKERIHTYLMFVSNNEIVFTPQIFPTSLHSRLRNVNKIVFMSATIGSEEMLHKRLGLGETIARISEDDLSSSIGTMGKRIIFPVSAAAPAPSITGSLLGAVELIAQEFGKVLVICNSFPDLEAFKNYLVAHGHATVTYKRDADITSFRDKTKGVLLTAGRFFGIDLSKNACQAVIIPKLPFVLGPIDSLAQQVLEDDRYANERVGNRLVQGFGRCNRGPEDRAVYFSLDGRLAADIMGPEDIFRYFPHRLRAESDYGQEFDDAGLDSCIGQGKRLLQGQIADFDAAITQRMTGESERPAQAPDRPFTKEIEGWHFLCDRRNYVDAALSFEQAIKDYEGQPTSLYPAWLHYLCAFAYHLAARFYNDASYKKKANENLNRAIVIGSNSWFSGLQLVRTQLNESQLDEKMVSEIEAQQFGETLVRAWQEFYARNQRKRTPDQAWEALCQGVQAGTHDEICDALGALLELIGFEVHHFRKVKGKPDMLAFSVFGTKYVAVIEVKSRETGVELGRDEVDQVTGHKAGYQLEYPNYRIFTLVVTNKEKQSDTAIEKAKHNTRIVTSASLVAFFRKYWPLIEEAQQSSEAHKRLDLITRIPSLQSIVQILEPKEVPLIELSELNVIFGAA